ncbi:FecR family protein [Opitutales bacterium]|nr:FecR family protein [Opitutales bacterium]
MMHSFNYLRLSRNRFIGLLTFILFGSVLEGQNFASQKTELEDLNERLEEMYQLKLKLKERFSNLQKRLDMLSKENTSGDSNASKLSIDKIPSRESLVEDGFPRVEQTRGLVSVYDQKSRSFVPATIGTSIMNKKLFSVPADGELIVSFPSKIAARVGENSRVLFGPAEKGRYEVDLRSGTVSALLDPERDKANSPSFAVRTKSGVTEATGTFYAVTEYKGQSYSAVKKGNVKKETTPPAKPDFSAYLKKSQKKSDD